MSTDPFAHDDAAYVLGALSPAERQAFERHLDECDSCKRSVAELAGLPGLLSGVEEASFTGIPQHPPVPDTLLPQLMRQVRRRGRRVRLLTVSGVAAAIALGLVLGALLFGGGTPTPGPLARGRTMTQVGQHVLTAQVRLESVAWGTRVHLQCRYTSTAAEWGESHAPSYALVLRAPDGTTQQLTTWRAVPGKVTDLVAGTDLRATQIRRVDVVPIGAHRPALTLAPLTS